MTISSCSSVTVWCDVECTVYWLSLPVHRLLFGVMSSVLYIDYLFLYIGYCLVWCRVYCILTISSCTSVTVWCDVECTVYWLSLPVHRLLFGVMSSVLYIDYLFLYIGYCLVWCRVYCILTISSCTWVTVWCDVECTVYWLSLPLNIGYCLVWCRVYCILTISSCSSVTVWCDVECTVYWLSLPVHGLLFGVIDYSSSSALYIDYLFLYIGYCLVWCRVYCILTISSCSSVTVWCDVECTVYWVSVYWLSLPVHRLLFGVMSSVLYIDYLFLYIGYCLVWCRVYCILTISSCTSVTVWCDVECTVYWLSLPVHRLLFGVMSSVLYIDYLIFLYIGYCLVWCRVYCILTISSCTSVTVWCDVECTVYWLSLPVHRLLFGVMSVHPVTVWCDVECTVYWLSLPVHRLLFGVMSSVLYIDYLFLLHRLLFGVMSSVLYIDYLFLFIGYCLVWCRVYCILTISSCTSVTVWCDVECTVYWLSLPVHRLLFGVMSSVLYIDYLFFCLVFIGYCLVWCRVYCILTISSCSSVTVWCDVECTVYWLSLPVHRLLFGVMSSVLYIDYLFLFIGYCLVWCRVYCILYLFLFIGYCLVWCRVYCILTISSCSSVTVWCDVECTVYWLSLPVHRLLFGVMSSVLYIDYLFLFIGYCLVWCRVYCILTISSCSSVTVWCDVECTVYWLSLPVHRLLFGVMSSVLYIDYLFLFIGYCLVWCRVYCILTISSCTSVTVWCDVECTVYWLSLPVHRLLFGVMSSVLYIDYLFLYIGYCLVWCRVYCILTISSCTSVTVWCDVECTVYWLSLPLHRLLFGVMSSVLYIDYLFLYIGYCLVWCRVYCILTISSWLHRLLFGVMSSVLYIDYLFLFIGYCLVWCRVYCILTISSCHRLLFGVMWSVLYIDYLFLFIGYCLVWCRVYCILTISSCTSVTVWCDVECTVYWLSLPVHRLLFGVMSSVLTIGYCLVWCRVYCILTISSCTSVTVWCDVECTVYWLSLPVHRLLFGVMSSVLYIDYLFLYIGYCLVWCRVYCILTISSCTSVTVWCDVECTVYWLSLPVHRLLFGVMSSVLYIDYLFLYIGYCLVWCRVYCILTISSCTSVTVWCDVECTVYWLSLPVHRLLFGVMSSVLYIDYLFLFIGYCLVWCRVYCILTISSCTSVTVWCDVECTVYWLSLPVHRLLFGVMSSVLYIDYLFLFIGYCLVWCRVYCILTISSCSSVTVWCDVECTVYWLSLPVPSVTVWCDVECTVYWLSLPVHRLLFGVMSSVLYIDYLFLFIGYCLVWCRVYCILTISSCSSVTVWCDVECTVYWLSLPVHRLLFGVMSSVLYIDYLFLFIGYCLVWCRVYCILTISSCTSVTVWCDVECTVYWLSLPVHRLLFGVMSSVLYIDYLFLYIGYCLVWCRVYCILTISSCTSVTVWCDVECTVYWLSLPVHRLLFGVMSSVLYIDYLFLYIGYCLVWCRVYCILTISSCTSVTVWCDVECTVYWLSLPVHRLLFGVMSSVLYIDYLFLFIGYCLVWCRVYCILTISSCTSVTVWCDVECTVYWLSLPVHRLLIGVMSSVLYIDYLFLFIGYCLVWCRVYCILTISSCSSVTVWCDVECTVYWLSLPVHRLLFGVMWSLLYIDYLFLFIGYCLVWCRV